MKKTILRKVDYSALGPILFFILTIVSPSTWAQTFSTRWRNNWEAPGTFKLAPEFSLYSSTQHYGPTGQVETPTGLNQYQRMEYNLNLAYGFNPYVTAFAKGSLVQVKVDHTRFIGNHFAPADQDLGLAIRAWQMKGSPSIKKTALDIQLGIEIPTYNNRTDIARSWPLLGDGTQNFLGGLFLQLPFAQNASGYWQSESGAFYLWRTAGFSQSIAWQTHLNYIPLKSGLWTGVSFNGAQSLQTDHTPGPSPTTPSPDAITASGGQFFINAVNPSYINAEAFFGYQTAENLRLRARIGHSVWGQASPSGLTTTLQLEWRIGKLSSNPSAQSPSEYGRSNQGFVNYNFEARVTKVNDRLNLVKIDKGSQEGVNAGQTFDLFVVKSDGSIGEAIARAKITDVKLNEAALTITEYYKEVWIEEGFIAKRPNQ